MQAGNLQQSVYFVVKNIDMCGQNVFFQQGYKGEDEAISAIKAQIRSNNNYCATIYKNKDKNFNIYIKAKVFTNPSDNKANWSNFKSIFYGKRYRIKTSSSYKEEYNEEQPFKGKGKKIEPFLVEGLDMFGFDLEVRTMESFDQAYQYIIETIGDQTCMCGMIEQLWKEKKFNAFIKDPRRCNPSQNKSAHWRFTTVLLGYEV